jgi:hypothetical protein
VRGERTFAEGTELTLRFALPPRPNGPAVEVDGTVVRSSDEGVIAIKFTQLLAIHRAAIVNFVERGNSGKIL